ncbi:hypothetical protein B0E46_03710 [Rhodanobacter sp. B04]|nr:hypothetical protein B0E46_03710 [Rhodanobacter sp. B04]
MSGTFSPRLSILPESQRRLWPELRPATGLGFVLYGGTAIALRLGHRQSVDFDFFTAKPLDREALNEAFSFIRRAIALQSGPETLTLNVPDAEMSDRYVKVSFFGAIDFGRYAAPDMTEDGVLQVASLDDLMATKLKVLMQRVEAKDYQDIAAMLNAGSDLSLGLAVAKEMFGNTFQPSESLKAMTWFEGGDLQRLTDDEKRALIEAASAVRRLPHVEMAMHGLGA